MSCLFYIIYYSKYYEADALAADPEYGTILSSLLGESNVSEYGTILGSLLGKWNDSEYGTILISLLAESNFYILRIHAQSKRLIIGVVTVWISLIF